MRNTVNNLERDLQELKEELASMPEDPEGFVAGEWQSSRLTYRMDDLANYIRNMTRWLREQKARGERR